MGRETEKLLKEEEFPEQIEQERTIHELPRHEHECGKKHGIVCRILTTLHLKKKSSDRQKLLSESQEHLPPPEGHPKGSKKEKKSKKKAKEAKSVDSSKTKARSNSVPTRIPQRTLSSLSANSNNNNNAFTTTYEMLDNESHHSCENLFEPNREHEETGVGEHKKVTIAVEDVTICDQHVYGDDNFGESYFTRPGANPSTEKLKSPNTSEYLRHQWRGRRAKKARKRIRRVMRATYHSLQSMTAHASNVFPSPQQVVSVVSTSPER